MMFHLTQASSSVTTAATAATTIEEQCTFFKKKSEKLTFENKLLRKEVGRTIRKSQEEKQNLHKERKVDKEKLKSLKNDLIQMTQLRDMHLTANMKFEIQISTLKKTLSEKTQQFCKKQKQLEKQIQEFELLFSIENDDLTSPDVHVAAAAPVTPQKPKAKRKRTPANPKPMSSSTRVRASKKKK